MRPLLVDGTNVVMRYAMAMWGADPGIVLEAVVRALRMAAHEAKTKHVVVCLDNDREGSVRRAIYPEYKAGRQIETKEWSRALGSMPMLRCVSVPGYEADDCIATMAWRFWSRSQHTAKAAVLSSDSDLHALADIADVYDFAKDGAGRNRHFVKRDPGWICEKHGIARPHLLTDLKVLAGEPGDNVPGPFGKHTVARARKLLAQYGTATLVAQLCQDLTSEQRDVIHRNIQLLTLKTDVVIPTIQPYECVLAP